MVRLRRRRDLVTRAKGVVTRPKGASFVHGLLAHDGEDLGLHTFDALLNVHVFNSVPLLSSPV